MRRRAARRWRSPQWCLLCRRLRSSSTPARRCRRWCVFRVIVSLLVFFSQCAHVARITHTNSHTLTTLRSRLHLRVFLTPRLSPSCAIRASSPRLARRLSSALRLLVCSRRSACSRRRRRAVPRLRRPSLPPQQQQRPRGEGVGGVERSCARCRRQWLPVKRRGGFVVSPRSRRLAATR